MGQAREHGELDDLVARTAGLQPGRRVFHALNGLIVFAFLRFMPLGKDAVAAVLSGIFLVALVVDLARLRVKALNVLFFRTFVYLASPREQGRIASSTWYLAGIALALWLFPRSWAEMAVLVLALADPIAGYVGRRWGGRWRLGTGTWVGSATFFAVTSVLLSVVARPFAALVAAFVVTAVEVLPWPLDDNLTIPLAACVALLLLRG